MSKRSKRAHPVDGTAIVMTLQRRGMEIAALLAHELGPWQTAKRKWGKGATAAWCPRCAGTVIVLPYGSSKTGSTSIQRSSPTLTGDALFEVCDGVGPL